MRILITGAKGQLGKEFFTIMHQYPGYNFEFYDKSEWDITDTGLSEKIILETGADYLINTSAYTKVDLAEDERDLCFSINAEAPGHLAKICRKAGTKLIHYSTDYVFNSDTRSPIKEDHPKNPVGNYAESKSKGEDLIMIHNPESIIIRTSWLYSSFGSNFVKTMIRLSKIKSTIDVVSDQTGSPSYARDLAHASLEIIRSDSITKDKRFSGYFHYCNTGSCSWDVFAQEIFNYLKCSVKVNSITTETFGAKAWRPKYSSLNCDRIINTFNVQIPDWKTSLHKCLDLIIKSDSN